MSKEKPGGVFIEQGVLKGDTSIMENKGRGPTQEQMDDFATGITSVLAEESKGHHTPNLKGLFRRLTTDVTVEELLNRGEHINGRKEKAAEKEPPTTDSNVVPFKRK
jgi:hypothetical protein